MRTLLLIMNALGAASGVYVYLVTKNPFGISSAIFAVILFLVFLRKE